MDRQQVVQRVTALDVNDVKTSDAFIREMRDGSMEAPRALVAMWVNKKEVQKSMRLIPDMEDLSIRPLLELSPEKLAPTDLAWVLSTASEGVAVLRDLLVRRLLTLLDDVKAAPQANIPNSEEQPLPRRVCDVAYLALRRVLFFEEKAGTTAMNAWAFLSMTEVQREAEINNFKRTQEFTRFMKG